MELTKWIYFQYRKTWNYPVYVRVKEAEQNAKITHLLNEIGFDDLSEPEVKRISIQRSHTRILSIQHAGPRLQQQINGSDLLDKYGAESLSLQAGTPIYTYRKVGVMSVPNSKTLWDLAINPELNQTEQMIGLRIILVRYLAQTLAEQGVLTYWGTVKDDTIIVMKQLHSFGEAIVIDANKKIIFSNGEELRIGANVKLLRKDKDASHSGLIKREELISFLSVNTCLLSFTGITPSMKKAIFDLSAGISASYASHEKLLNL